MALRRHKLDMTNIQQTQTQQSREVAAWQQHVERLAAQGVLTQRQAMNTVVALAKNLGVRWSVPGNTWVSWSLARGETKTAPWLPA